MPRHFSLIDGLRGIAALAVVIFHYHHFYLVDHLDRPNMPPAEAQAYGTWLFPVYTYGHHAVELFWVISGFVFAHVYLNRPATLWGFSVARFARLYPLHLATLLIVAGLQIASQVATGHWQIYGSNDLRHFILHLGFASNWSTLNRGLSFNGPIWSVSLEIIAYALFFLALPLLRRFGLPMAVVLCAAAWGMTLVDLPLLRARVFACAGYFFLGCALYGLLGRVGPRAWGAVGVAAVVAVGGIVLGGEAVVISAVSACLILMLALLEGRVNLGAWVQRLGDMSYSIYLVHVPLQMMVLFIADTAFGGSRAFADHPLTMPVYLLVVVVVADLAYRQFEKPVGRVLRQRLDAKPQY